MVDLLGALHWRVSVASGIWLIAVIAFATSLVLALGAATVSLTGVSVIALQCILWALWLIWLGILFPRSRQRDEDRPCPYPYRRAFKREILPGIAVAFSQILRPGLTGFAENELSLAMSSVIGLPLLLLGAGILWSGVATLGLARTLFVYEYIPTDTPVTTDGIFRFLRHPLFLGGSMLSLGLAICTDSQIAIELGAINACVIPIYVQLEDRRCCARLGDAYADYRAAVGGVIPRRRSAISLSALEHHAAGNIGPTTPRNLATKP